MDTLSNIILYAENHIDFLSKNFLVFEIPSKSTIARVLRSCIQKRLISVCK